MLCPRTWPHWKGIPQLGVKEILDHVGIAEEKYTFGKTKIFIINPKTVRQNFSFYINDWFLVIEFH